jgi:cell division protein FtsI/penicillin-binding protein 2
LVNHYLFSKLTGIQQSGEITGFVNSPNDGDGLNVRYANMAFGQGLTVTPVQLVAAYASILNGGTYYQPTLIASYSNNGQVDQVKPKVLEKNVISSQASAWIKEMTQNALEYNYPFALKSGYVLGGKSGTAQIPDGHGGYQPNLYDGTYIGYISGRDGLKYIMMLRLDQPKTGNLASYDAVKVWAQACNALINNFAIPSNNP